MPPDEEKDQVPDKEPTYTVTVIVRRSDLPGAKMRVTGSEISATAAHQDEYSFLPFIRQFDTYMPEFAGMVNKPKPDPNGPKQ